MNWIKRKIKKWLGIYEIEKTQRLLHNDIKEIKETISDLVSIGVDVHFKSPHMILIYSKLNGGQLKHIEADFQSIRELKELVSELRHRYKTKMMTIDKPYNMDWRLL